MQESHIVSLPAEDPLHGDDLNVTALLPANLMPAIDILRREANKRRKDVGGNDMNDEPKIKAVFPCRDCGEKFVGESFLLRHASEEHGRALHPWEMARPEPWTLSLVLHPANKSLTPPPGYVQFDCPDCDVIALDEVEMKRHREKEHSANNPEDDAKRKAPHKQEEDPPDKLSS